VQLNKFPDIFDAWIIIFWRKEEIQENIRKKFIIAKQNYIFDLFNTKSDESSLRKTIYYERSETIEDFRIFTSGFISCFVVKFSFLCFFSLTNQERIF